MIPPPKQMIKFPSIIEGIKHHNSCPICKSNLTINDRDLHSIQDTHDNHYILTFYVDVHGENTVEIDTSIESIIIRFSSSYSLPNYPVGGNVSVSYIPTMYTSKQFSGLFLHGLTIECKSCCQFSFNLQLHIDLKEHKMFGVYLNSESISVEDNGMIHEIKNIYSMNETRYACFSKNGDEKETVLPLVPLNVKIPQDAIGRIRKLLIFS